jgi:hypothetical protein
MAGEDTSSLRSGGAAAGWGQVLQPHFPIRNREDVAMQDLTVRVRVVPSGAAARLVPVLFVCDPKPV